MTLRNNRGTVNPSHFFLGLFLCLFLGSFALLFVGCMSGKLLTTDPTDSTISDGSRVGVVNKFSTKGLTGKTKTWEGELLVGGAGTVQKSHWQFTVDSDDVDLIKAVDEAKSSQAMVELFYHKYLWVLKINGETTYFVTGIKPAGDSAKATSPTSSGK